MKRGRPISVSDTDLLEAAKYVFLEKGLDATTTEVAQRANISESVIFYRYKTKEALLVAVVEQQLSQAVEFKKLNDYVGKGNLEENLLGIAMILIEKMKTVLPLLMLAFSSPTKMNLLRERLHQFHPIFLGPLVDYFQAEADVGRMHQVDAHVLANTFYGGVREYVFKELFTNNMSILALESIKYMISMIDVLFAGIIIKEKVSL